VTNTAKITNMIGVTCQRNMFSEIKIAIKRDTKITYSVWCDAMIKDVRRKETSTFAALSVCTYNDEICFVGIEPKSIVCHPVEISLSQSPSCLRETSVSTVDKDRYTLVSSVYK